MLYFVSLYFKNNVYSGANKRFEELGRRFAEMFGESFRIIVCNGEKPDWISPRSCLFVPSYSSKFERLRTFNELRLLLSNVDQGKVISDFMPIPFSALRKHRHYQLIYDLRNFTEFQRGGLHFLSARFQRWQLTRSERIITISEHSKTDLINRCAIPRRKILVSYCGVGSEYFQSAHLADKDLDILYIASFEPRKNHAGLLAALEHAHRKLSIRFIGRDLGTKPAIREMANSLTSARGFQFEFIDSMSEAELIASYRRAKVLVFPSFLEGFGMPLVEALAANCRIACSDIDVFREICAGNANYFDPSNPREMWSVIDQAISLEDAPNTSDFAGSFLWENIAKKLLEDLQKDSMA